MTDLDDDLSAQKVRTSAVKDMSKIRETQTQRNPLEAKSLNSLHFSNIIVLKQKKKHNEKRMTDTNLFK